MFGLFASQKRKMRESAGHWLELARKVQDYRRDVLSPGDVAALQSRIAELSGLLKERAGPEKLKIGIERLEEVLRPTGGAIYPKSSLVENVEFFLVAAIVILGIRTYFVQPFKIPTNSMWPTYNGMTPEVWKDPAEAPGILRRAARFVLFGAQRRDLVAPKSGRVSVLVVRGGRLYEQAKAGRKWLLFPTVNKEYTFYIDDVPVPLEVPGDFDFDWTFQELTGLDEGELAQIAGRATRGSGNVRLVPLDLKAEKDQPFLSFDIVTGDQLFVDRFSYHFFRPRVGQGFVFRTDHINSPYMLNRNTGRQLEQYYIKRLAGGPGDVLEIREPELWRNGAPIAGSDAFRDNALRVDGYKGYFNSPVPGTYLGRGDSLTIPKSRYFALGDNSGNSQDGRYWGFVPAKDVVGRPLFVYYPFTRHWGPAR